MLICPNCQFENPDPNKFCQQCGTSLTDLICPGCQSVVPFSVETCPHCGTATGQIYLAVVAIEGDRPPTFSTYLDAQKRYRLLDPQPTLPNLRVIDCLPYQATLLSVLADAPEPETITLPTIAHPYLALAKNPAIPKIHDTWLGQDFSVVILADRVEQPLGDRIATATPPQIAHWFQQMTDLWTALEPHHAGYSLLDLANLQVDQNEQLHLRQLHTQWVTTPEAHLTNLKQTNLEQSPDKTTSMITETSTDLSTHLSTSSPDVDAVEQNTEQGTTDSTDSITVESAVDNLETESLDQLKTTDELETTRAISVESELKNSESVPPEIGPTTSPKDPTVILEPKSPPTLQDLGKLWLTILAQKPPEQGTNSEFDTITLLCQDLVGGTIALWQALRSRLNAIAMSTLQSPEASTAMTTSETSYPANSQAPTLPRRRATDRLPDAPDVPTGSVEAALPTEPDFDSDEDSDEDGDSESSTAVLPMCLRRLDDAGRTDVGRQRDHNEDCFSIHSEMRKTQNLSGRKVQAKALYILCDGMGGHAGGEVASALAVETLQNYFLQVWQDTLPTEEIIRRGIIQANQAIFEQNQKNSSSGSGRMGTTLAMMLVQDSEAAIAHVGDSRIYRVTRRAGLEQLTIDHEVGQREIQRGVEPDIAYARPDAYQLTQALGPRNENFINPEVQFIELNEDMLFILSSDGLTDNSLLEIYWESHLEPLLSSRTSLEEGAHALIDLANQHNGHDNITAIAVRVKVQPYLATLM